MPAASRKGAKATYAWQQATQYLQAAASQYQKVFTYFDQPFMMRSDIEWFELHIAMEDVWNLIQQDDVAFRRWIMFDVLMRARNRGGGVSFLFKDYWVKFNAVDSTSRQIIFSAITFLVSCFRLHDTTTCWWLVVSIPDLVAASSGFWNVMTNTATPSVYKAVIMGSEHAESRGWPCNFGVFLPVLLTFLMSSKKQRYRCVWTYHNGDSSQEINFVKSKQPCTSC